MRELFKNTNHLHFIGIGGIGMSGMAELLFNHGFNISGSDINKSERIKHLKKCGLKIFNKHDKNNIKKCDLIVYSSAIKKDNPEIKEGYKRNIPIIKRAELLGELINVKKLSIAVSGTHGKTTTSSMVGSILHEAELDPTLIIGGIVNKFKSNNISGSGDIIVVEADEFDKSFLSLKPTYSIINNLDLEHIDCYKDFKSLKNTFLDFANSIPFYGKIIINNDCKNLDTIVNKINKQKKSFGIKNKSEIMAKNIIFSKSYSNFKLIQNENDSIEINLNSPGIHNVYNALAAATICLELNVSLEVIKSGLEKYTGVKRRFEISYQNKNNEIMIVDDYAHHPIEVAATLNAAKSGWEKRIIAVFQPHLFSRTKNFYKEFAESLSIADIIIITDIYAAREEKIPDVTSDLIINELNKKTNKVLYIKEVNDIPHQIKKIAKNNDMIICMGAGNINKISIKINQEMSVK
tara:strand:+ start:4395 stop:5783 length:1389 start_codon:yes stop_codon:yes gene_type:complete